MGRPSEPKGPTVEPRQAWRLPKGAKREPKSEFSRRHFRIFFVICSDLVLLLSFCMLLRSVWDNFYTNWGGQFNDVFG